VALGPDTPQGILIYLFGLFQTGSAYILFGFFPLRPFILLVETVVGASKAIPRGFLGSFFQPQNLAYQVVWHVPSWHCESGRKALHDRQKGCKVVIDRVAASKTRGTSGGGN